MIHLAEHPLGAMKEGRESLSAPTEHKHSRGKGQIFNSLLVFRKASLPSLEIIKCLIIETNPDGGLG